MSFAYNFNLRPYSVSIAQMLKKDYIDMDKTLSGLGGIETGGNAAEFILLGADTVQVWIVPETIYAVRAPLR